MTLYTRYELWVDGKLHTSIEVKRQASQAFGSVSIKWGISTLEERKHAAFIKLKRYAESFVDSDWQIFEVKKADFRGNFNQRNKKAVILK